MKTKTITLETDNKRFTFEMPSKYRYFTPVITFDSNNNIDVRLKCKKKTILPNKVENANSQNTRT